jgi:Restriction endonuclease S subunits
MSLPRYPEYKDSGVEWLGSVPAHWEVDALRRRAALNPSKAEVRAVETEKFVSFLPMEAVGERGDLDLSRTRRVSEVLAGYTYFREGDIAFAKITPCFENGKGARMVGLRGGFGFGTTELTVVRPDPDLLDGHYLDWVLRSVPFRKRGEAAMYGAGGQKRVPDEFVREFVIGWPDIREQSLIAKFLDRETGRIDALLAEQEKLLALLAEKRQATISHAVTRGLDPNVPMKDSGIAWLGEVPAHWQVGPIKRYVEILDGRRVPLSAEERSYRPGDFPYYGASGIIDSIDDYLFDEDLVLVSEDGANLLNRSSPIAFVARGRYWVNNHAHILRPVDGLVDFWAARIEQLDLAPVVTGSAQPKLTIEALANLLVAVPPSALERQSIGCYLEQHDRRISELESSAEKVIHLLKERRGALISAAVTGQIDVRGLIEADAA